MQELQVVPELVVATEGAKHWFFDAQVFWGGTLAFLGTSLTAWQLYRATQAEKEIAAEELRQRRLIVAGALQAEVALAAGEFMMMSDRPAIFRSKLKRSGNEPIIRDFYEKTFFELHQHELGILGPVACRRIQMSYRNARNAVLHFIRHKQTVLQHWEDTDEEALRVVTEKLLDIYKSFNRAGDTLATITGKKLEVTVLKFDHV